jgi:hypothetical protein
LPSLSFHLGLNPPPPLTGVFGFSLLKSGRKSSFSNSSLLGFGIYEFLYSKPISFSVIISIPSEIYLSPIFLAPYAPPRATETAPISTKNSNTAGAIGKTAAGIKLPFSASCSLLYSLIAFTISLYLCGSVSFIRFKFSIIISVFL